MKVHPVNLLAALVISGLLSFGLGSLDSNTMKATIGVGSFMFFAITLAMSIGFVFENARSGANVKVVSVVFFVAAILLNFVFGFFSLSQMSYIITSGIFFLLYVVIANAIFGTGQ